ncbi:hypothetical protein MHYP_G00078520 [Metynnis hypsauchen]
MAEPVGSLGVAGQWCGVCSCCFVAGQFRASERLSLEGRTALASSHASYGAPSCRRSVGREGGRCPPPPLYQPRKPLVPQSLQDRTLLTCFSLTFNFLYKVKRAIEQQEVL